MPIRSNPSGQIICLLVSALAILSAAGCSSKDSEAPPPTIAPAQAAVSPPVAGGPAGTVRPLAERGLAALFDAETSSVVVLGSRTVTSITQTGAPRAVPLPGPATAMAGDDEGRLFVSTRGGYFRVDLAAASATLPVALTASWC